MMQIDAIERYVDLVLENKGFCKGEKGLLWQFLHHLYTADTLFRMMTENQRELIERIQTELSAFFVTKIDLKERKRRGKKRKYPPTPPIKEKKGQEKVEKTLSLAERRESFHQECLEYVDKFDNQQLSDFYNYWSEEDPKIGKMRFEKQRFWNTDRRLKRWINKSYASENTAAALRLERTKQSLSKEEAKAKSKEADSAKQQQAATERDDANEKLFRQLEENKRKAVSYKEYLRKKNEKAE
jgi:hypothetical protein